MARVMDPAGEGVGEMMGVCFFLVLISMFPTGTGTAEKGENAAPNCVPILPSSTSLASSVCGDIDNLAPYCLNPSGCTLQLTLKCDLSLCIFIDELPKFMEAQIHGGDSIKTYSFFLGMGTNSSGRPMKIRVKNLGTTDCDFAYNASNPSQLPVPGLELEQGVFLYEEDGLLRVSVRSARSTYDGREFIIVDRTASSGTNSPDLSINANNFNVEAVCWQSLPLPIAMEQKGKPRIMSLKDGSRTNQSCFPAHQRFYQVIPTAGAGGMRMTEQATFNEIVCAGRSVNCSFSPCIVAGLFPNAVKCGPAIRADRLTIVSVLNLSGWDLSGAIPESIGNMSDLGVLRLSDNNFSGSIPLGIAGLQKLVHLDLSNNMLMGNLTESPLSQLSSLGVLRLDSNRGLTGNLSNRSLPSSLRELDIKGTDVCVVAELAVSKKWSPICPDQSSSRGPGKGSGKSGTSTQTIALLTAACVLLLCGLLAAAHVALFMVRKSKKRRGCGGAGELGGGVFRRPKLCTHLGHLLSLSVDEIEAATEKMSKEIGRGLFGMVYEGRLVDGRRVSIKFRAKGTTAVLSDFRLGVRKLSLLNHRNIVKLVGFCDEGGYEALVYDFVPHGSISDYLHDNKTGMVLTWQARLKILQGAAAGIDYLHRQGMIHCDVKSRNILLDDKYDAKVTDGGYFHPSLFGDAAHSDLKAYFGGYIDPEYVEKGELDKKSDIYSFGVVMLEAVSGRKALVDVSVPQQQQQRDGLGMGMYGPTPSAISPRPLPPHSGGIGAGTSGASSSSRCSRSAAIAALLMEDSGEQQDGTYDDRDDGELDEEDPTPPPPPPPPRPIAEWARDVKAEGKLNSLIDPKLMDGAYSPASVTKVVDIALWCVENSSSARPSSMKQVRDKLDEAMKVESRMIPLTASASMSLSLVIPVANVVDPYVETPRSDVRS